MFIVDAHAHIFPAKIALKATESVGKFYDVGMRYVGSPENLLESGKAIGVDKYFVHSVATTPAQVRSINAFIAEQCAEHPEFIGFGAMHPGVEDIQAEVDNIIALGLKGIKMHPDFQRFNIDDECALPIYECAQGRLPILFHMGDYRYDWSHPARLARVIDAFPDLDCIAAHFGGYTAWDEALDCLLGRRCWIDTSSTLGMVNDYDYVRGLVSKWGTERMLFGTDFPMWDHAEELERFEQLGITGDELENVMGKNAMALLARYE